MIRSFYYHKIFVAFLVCIFFLASFLLALTSKTGLIKFFYCANFLACPLHNGQSDNIIVLSLGLLQLVSLLSLTLGYGLRSWG